MILVLVLLAACTPAAPTVMGRASVIDGDTLEIHDQRIRLWGVDAPEGRQSCDAADGAVYACGRLSANRLDQHLQDKTVACFEEDTDRYGRMVARCEVDGEDVGARDAVEQAVRPAGWSLSVHQGKGATAADAE